MLFSCLRTIIHAYLKLGTDSHSRERAPECLPQGERLYMFRVVFHLEVAFV